MTKLRDELVMGCEQEVDVAIFVDGKRLPSYDANRLFFEKDASLHRETLPFETTGFSFGTTAGDRHYVDRYRYEVAQAETTDVRNFIAAREAALAQLSEVAAALAATKDRVRLSIAPTDYVTGEGNGSHFNHWVRTSAPPIELATLFVALTPFSGGGGFASRPMGFSYVLSPRAERVGCLLSGCSSRWIGLIDLHNDDSCPRNGRRLQVLLGDSNRSQISTGLRAGLQAIALRLWDRQLFDARGCELLDPVGALWKVNRDLAFNTPLDLVGGKATILEILRRLLERMSAAVGDRAPGLPQWVEQVFNIAFDQLNDLEGGAREAEYSLDWAILRRLARFECQRHGVEFDIELPLLAGYEQALRGEAAKFGGPGSTLPLPELLASVLGKCPNRSLRRKLATAGLDLRRVVDVCNNVLPHLQRLVMLYFEVGPDTLWKELQATLDADWPGVTPAAIETAKHAPESIGRAHLRGNFVREYAGQPGHYVTWNSLVKPGFHAHLPDPLAIAIDWRAEDHGRGLPGRFSAIFCRRRRENA